MRAHPDTRLAIRTYWYIGRDVMTISASRLLGFDVINTSLARKHSLIGVVTNPEKPPGPRKSGRKGELYEITSKTTPQVRTIRPPPTPALAHSLTRSLAHPTHDKRAYNSPL